MTIKTCRHCDIRFNRDDAAPIPHDRCGRCHEEIEALVRMKKERKSRLTEEQKRLLAEKFEQAFLDGAKAPVYDSAAETPKPLPKQARYQDAKGDDWIDEFARTATPEEFRGAMKFTVGKYLRRAGKKDSMISEVRKMRDYCQRWEQYEQELEQ